MHRAIYPDGTFRTLLRIPNYSFSWQLTDTPEKRYCGCHGEKSTKTSSVPKPVSN